MEFQYNPNQNQGVNPYGYVSSQGSSMYGSPDTVNRSFFNQNGGTNWKDSTKFAYEQIAQREANAFNVAVMNYQNEYNSPLNQMKRRMEAGLNPYSDIAMQPSAQAPGAGSARGTASHAQATAQKMNAASNMIGQLFDVVSGVAGIQKQLQTIRYNEEAYPIMLNRLRYQASNESLRGFLSELGINSGTLGLAKTAYDLGIPLQNIPWFTHGPQMYGSSIGWDFDDLDKFNSFLNESPYAKAFAELINLRKRQGANVAADRALKGVVKKLSETKLESEEQKQALMKLEESMKEWELNAKDITGVEFLDKLIYTMFQNFSVSSRL